ncbi:MAG: CDP-glycerol glycerophosphotransferase family protein [Mogibacterium sp.]|nr:CDP-glycerol glycerophosphotransferase family protein [Mogibacterium sp.]
MSFTKKAKKIIFDISKKNKAFRVVSRGARDILYRAKMTADDPFGKIDDKLVYFQTFSGRGYSDSPKAMYEYMMKAPEYKDFRFVWSFKEPEKFRFLENDRTTLVKFRTKADNVALRTAKYWITNYRMLNHQYPRKGQIYVQCWHGTPLKRLGYDLESSDNVMNSGQEIRSKYKSDAKKFSYIISPSPFTTEKFASAWNLVKTHQTHKIIEEGYPRNDRLINTTPEERTELRKQLGVENKKVILYAPTWRDNQHTSGEGYTYKTEVDFDKLREALGDEYVILFRAHYLVANSFDFDKYAGFVEDVSSYSDINELYIAADILVTDYSSVFFDYANLRKPVIFYMYDLEQYANELRGFYFSLDELPGPIVRDEDALIAEVRACDTWQPDQKYEEFCAKYNPKDDGNASARVLKRIIVTE